MAFADKDHRDSPFITGYAISVKHVYAALETHETSQAHRNATNAALQCSRGCDVDTLLNTHQLKQREKEIATRRLVLQRLIDITLFIGRQGLAYRGRKHEAAFSLDEQVNHGNFLELVLLVSEYDVILQTHVQNCIAESKKKRAAEIRKKEKAGTSKPWRGKRGRGSLVTLLSKSFINKMIKTIAYIGQKKIFKDVEDSVIYSIMVDSTQDVAVMDQLAICIRYVVQGTVYERLLNLSVIDDSSGVALFEHLKVELQRFGIPLSNLVACSFDGASNMKGRYNGLQAYLKKENPKVIYTHCMSHVLNLVVADATVNCLQAENLFGLAEESASFLSSSHKRMSVWEKQTKKHHSAHDKLYRLKKIGATRWWSKHKALSSIIDFNCEENEISSSKFVNFLSVLFEISSGSFDSKTKVSARNLIHQWCKFETLFTSFLILDLFSVTSPVSIFMQAKTMNYSKAWYLIETLLNQIQEKRSDTNFTRLYENCKLFAHQLEALFKDKDISDFSHKWVGKRKIMPGEEAADESQNISPNQRQKNAYFNILDYASNSIQERFEQNKELLLDCSWLDPQKYDEISKIEIENFPRETLKILSRLINIERNDLLQELKQFAGQYKAFAKIFGKTSETGSASRIATETESEHSDDEDSSDTDNDKIKLRSPTTKCFNCLSCAFKIIHDLASPSSLFLNLYSAFKFVMTLPCTQVTCERVFSKLKIIKHKLRSTLSPDLLAPLMLIYVERDLFYNINKDEIINEISNTSGELRLDFIPHILTLPKLE